MSSTNNQTVLSVEEQNKMAAGLLVEVAFMINNPENEEYEIKTFRENIKALDPHTLIQVAKRLNTSL